MDFLHVYILTPSGVPSAWGQNWTGLTLTAHMTLRMYRVCHTVRTFCSYPSSRAHMHYHAGAHWNACNMILISHRGDKKEATTAAESVIIL